MSGAELRALYRTAGLAAPNWRARPKEHLAHQLEFIAHHLSKSRDAEDIAALANLTLAWLDTLRWVLG